MSLLQRKELLSRALLPRSQTSALCPTSSSTRSTSAATPTSRVRRTWRSSLRPLVRSKRWCHINKNLPRPESEYSLRYISYSTAFILYLPIQSSHRLPFLGLVDLCNVGRYFHAVGLEGSKEPCHLSALDAYWVEHCSGMSCSPTWEKSEQRLTRTGMLIQTNKIKAITQG